MATDEPDMRGKSAAAPMVLRANRHGNAREKTLAARKALI